MRITLTSKLVNARVSEGSAFNLVASFFDDSTDAWSASAPSTARYRIDRISSRNDPGVSQAVLEWTSLTPATSNTIAVTGSQNVLQSQFCYEEPRQITLQANAGLSTQFQETFRYWVTNLAAQ